MSMKNDIHNLAIQCIAAPLNERAAIAKQAGALLEHAPAYSTYSAFKRLFHLSYFASVNSSSKIIKGADKEVDTLILYLAASNNAGVELCKSATKECRMLCLVCSGRAKMESKRDHSKRRIAIARVIKSWIMHYRSDIARAVLAHEIVSKQASALRKGRSFACRLNGTSDIDHSQTIAAFKDVSFYDYTKNNLPDALPANYSITYSFANLSPARVRQYRKAVAMGLNIAVPVHADAFKRATSLPYAFDADRDDLRHLDKESGQLAILKIKKSPNYESDKQSDFVLGFEGVRELARLIGLGNLQGKLAA